MTFDYCANSEAVRLWTQTAKKMVDRLDISIKLWLEEGCQYEEQNIAELERMRDERKLLQDGIDLVEIQHDRLDKMSRWIDD